MDTGRLTAAPECVKFALRKLEDMHSSGDAAQSGATKLSRVFSELQSIQMMLSQFHQVLMNAKANWEKSQNSMMELEDVCKCVEIAIFTFVNRVGDIKPITIPETFKHLNPKPVNFIVLHKLINDVQKIKSEVRSINIEHLSAPRRVDDLFDPLSQCNIDDIWLLGLDIYYKCILQRLVDQSLQTRSVVQVVGTKVFAKTVLAEKIYRSTKVKTHFEACFWLFPPIRLDTDNIGLSHCDLYKPIDILRKMLLKLGDTNFFDAHGEDYHIMSQLRQSLNGKRCLVVVNNNWMKLWTVVNAVFPDGNNGSRVLITTEEQGQGDYKYELPFHNYDDSIKLKKELLLKKKGKLLKEPGKRDIWELQFDRILLYLGDDDSIKLYSTLPSVVKMCIAYTVGVFPCGSIILADSLIQLWIVEGIIPHEEGTTMEEIAKSYLYQLLQRGLFHIIEAYYHNQANHPIRSIILHPSMHRIFNSAAQEITNLKYHSPYNPVMVKHHVDVLNTCDDPEGFDKNLINLHRLAFHLQYQFNRISSFGKVPKLQHSQYPSLHSLFFFGYLAPVEISPFYFLRVLAVFSSHIRFPEEYTPCWLDGLINLRYLGFIACLVEGRSLGKTLDSLSNLKILDLSASIVSGLSEFLKHTKLDLLGPLKEEFTESWSPVPDMSQ